MNNYLASTTLSHLLGRPALPSDIRIWRTIIEVCSRAVAGEEGSLLIMDDAGESLVFAMTWAATERGSEGILVGQKVTIGQGITGLAAQTRQVQVGAPIYSGVELSPTARPRNVLAAPMLVADTVVGVITVVRLTSTTAFTANDADLLGKVAALAGLVVWLIKQTQSLNDLYAVQGDGRSMAEQELTRSVRRLIGLAGGDIPRVLNLFHSVENLACSPP